MTFLLALIGYILSVGIAFVGGFGIAFWYIHDKHPEAYEILMKKEDEDEAKEEKA